MGQNTNPADAGLSTTGADRTLDYSTRQGGPPAPVDAPVRREYATAPVQYCAYCGAALNPFYYFCIRCATPYKEPDAVVPAARPMQLTDGMRVHRMAPHTWTLFFTYVAVVIAASVISSVAIGLHNPALAYLVATLILFVTTFVFGAIHWRALAPQFRRIGFDHWAAWAGLGVLPLLLGLNYVYHTLLQKLLSEEAGHSRLSGVGLPYLAMVVVFCAFPALTEEIAFRGLLQHWLEVALTPFKAIGFASVLFMTLHFSFLSAPYLLLVGLLLGLVKYKTRSLYPSILIHFLHNLVVITWFRL